MQIYCFAGQENDSEAGEDEDGFKILGEVFIGHRTDQLGVDCDEEKAQEVIQIDDSVPNEVHAEENDATNSHFHEIENPKISMTKAASSSSPKVDGNHF